MPLRRAPTATLLLAIATVARTDTLEPVWMIARADIGITTVSRNDDMDSMASCAGKLRCDAQWCLASRQVDEGRPRETAR